MKVILPTSAPRPSWKKGHVYKLSSQKADFILYAVESKAFPEKVILVSLITEGLFAEGTEFAMKTCAEFSDDDMSSYTHLGAFSSFVVKE